MITLELSRKNLQHLVDCLEATVPTVCRGCGKEIIRCPLCVDWTAYYANPDCRYGGLSVSDMLKSPFHIHIGDSSRLSLGIGKRIHLHHPLKSSTRRGC